MFKVNNKDTLVLVFLLLTLNRYIPAGILSTMFKVFEFTVFYGSYFLTFAVRTEI